LGDLLELREALLGHGDRVWSYLCDDAACCPPEGQPYLDCADATDVAAAHVLHGRSVLMTRAEVIASVATPPLEEAAPVLNRLPASRGALQRLAGQNRVGRLGRLLAASLVRFDDPRAELAPGEVAELVALLDDNEVRDVLLQRIANTDDPALRTLINELARRTPAGEGAPVAIVLAVSAYLAGDGLIASAAIDRALATDPNHGLASCLVAALDSASTRTWCGRPSAVQPPAGRCSRSRGPVPPTGGAGPSGTFFRVGTQPAFRVGTQPAPLGQEKPRPKPARST
jgi:hypothetical protein